jgi:hypothetical protein
VVYLRVGDHEGGEKEEGRPTEVQHGDEARADEVPFHVGPDERVLSQHRRTGDHPKKVEHLEIAVGPRIGKPSVAPLSVHRVPIGAKLEKVCGRHVPASLRGQLKCPSRRSVESMRNVHNSAVN